MRRANPRKDDTAQLQSIMQLPEKLNSGLKQIGLAFLWLATITTSAGRAQLIAVNNEPQSKDIDTQAAQRPQYLQSVEVGMPIESVLAGLSEHYILHKLSGLSGMPIELEEWIVQSKDMTNPEAGAVKAIKGRVWGVDKYIVPSSNDQGTVNLTRALFRELFANSQPVPAETYGVTYGLSPSGGEAMAKLFNDRQVLATVGLRDAHYGNMDEQEIHISVGKFDYCLCLNTLNNGLPSVELRKVWGYDVSPTNPPQPPQIPEANPSWRAPVVQVQNPRNETGEICIESFEDAELYVDGQLIGSPPATLKLAVGPHLIESKHPGTGPYQRQVALIRDSYQVIRAIGPPLRLNPFTRMKLCPPR
jgi:hypothetical protein